MQDLLVIISATVVVIGSIFLMWTAFCLVLKGLFKIADKVFGL